MDALYTGNKISKIRKQKGLTQKDLAGMLHVTDKAVSKWERGLNFPDISMLEKLADVLEISVVELLGIENSSNEQVVSEVADLARQEKEKIVRELYYGGWLTIISGIIVLAGVIYTSKVLADNNLYGLPQMASIGLCGYIGVMIGHGLAAVRKAKKLLK